MSTRAQARKKQSTSKKKDTQNEDEEIIEIEDYPVSRPIKNSKKKKDNTENSSSEATTPNKKKQKKKNNDKNENELIEIMDIEIPEDDPITNKKKVSAPAPTPPRQKKIISQITINNKTKKDDKLSDKSINKNNSKEKSPIINGKKEKNVQSITLDESENENNENEIQVTNEVKTISDKKKSSKPQGKKSANKPKEISNIEEKKNKKNLKNGIVKKNEKNQEVCELSISEDTEDEKSKEKDKKPIQKKKKDKNNSNISKKSSDKFNSGFLSSRKASQNKNNISDKKEELKSKSTIKVSLKEEKMNNLLGRKRKPDDRKEKPKTPEKDSNKSETSNPKSPKQKNSSQINAGKKSRTPLKNGLKKNIKTNNLFIPKMNEQNCKKEYVVPELAVLNQLIIEYGFEKVLDSLCKPKFEQKIKLDSCLQGLKESCSSDKLPLILFKMFYSYFESKFEEKMSDKRSTSAKKGNILKHLTENISQKSKNNDNKSIFSLKDQCEEETPIQIEDEEIQEVEEKNEKKK